MTILTQIARTESTSKNIEIMAAYTTAELRTLRNKAKSYTYARIDAEIGRREALEILQAIDARKSHPAKKCPRCGRPIASADGLCDDCDDRDS